MEFKDRVVLVTGSGKGIGKAIATKFVEEGASVCINDIVLEDAEKTSEELKKREGTAFAVQADVSKEEDVKRMFDLLLERFGTIDILVNNAGSGDRLMVEDMPHEIWKRVIDINLNAVFFVLQGCNANDAEEKRGQDCEHRICSCQEDQLSRRSPLHRLQSWTPRIYEAPRL
jgi:NAD(P)-dependent dehydrogenase (short-subunit alcohol dehydrogenase family)